MAHVNGGLKLAQAPAAPLASDEFTDVIRPGHTKWKEMRWLAEKPGGINPGYACKSPRAVNEAVAHI